MKFRACVHRMSILSSATPQEQERRNRHLQNGPTHMTGSIFGKMRFGTPSWENMLTEQYCASRKTGARIFPSAPQLELYVGDGALWS